jgi:hypothetical protein
MSEEQEKIERMQFLADRYGLKPEPQNHQGRRSIGKNLLIGGDLTGSYPISIVSLLLQSILLAIAESAVVYATTADQAAVKISVGICTVLNTIGMVTKSGHSGRMEMRKRGINSY